MARFKRVAVTNKGKELIASQIAGVTELTFTKVSASSEVLGDTVDLTSLLSLDGVRQTARISNVEKINTSQVKIMAEFNNSGLLDGYAMETIGVYARDKAGTETLLSVIVADNPDYMPATNGINLSTISFELIIDVSNNTNVSMTVDTSALVTVGMLKNYYATEEKHGIAKLYSELEAETTGDEAKKIVEAGNGEEREFIREDPNGGAIYGESPWEKLMKVLDHTKILTVKGLVKILRKIIKPATDSHYGLTTNNNIKNLITTHAPKPDLSPYVTYTKGYINTNNTDSFVRTNGILTWASNVIEMWENATWRGSLHTNGVRAYYKVPGRNNGNFNEIMDNHDMAVRDAQIQSLSTTVQQITAIYVRDLRLAGYLIETGPAERAGYVLTFANEMGNNTVQYGRRALQQNKGGTWYNVPFA